MTTSPRQLNLLPSSDPTGNGQPSVQVILELDAAALQPNVYFVQHGGQRLKVVIANPQAGSEDHFELDANGHVLVEYV